ncbi:hypothetical protein ACSQ5K_15175 [Pseudomonas sp. PhalM4]
MPTTDVFEVKQGTTEISGSAVYVMLSCLQTKSPNLDLMGEPYTHRFAAVFPRQLGQELIEVLEQVHLNGAISPVKVIAADDAQIHVFLDGRVASSTLPAIESTWMRALEDCTHAWRVSFARVDELSSGSSDYELWRSAREVLDSEAFEKTACPTPGEGSASADAVTILPPEQRDPACATADYADGLWNADRKKLAELYLPVSAQRKISSARCMHALLAEGIRMLELGTIKVGDRCAPTRERGLSICCLKQRNKLREEMEVSPASAALIESHIKLNDLHAGDYLFFSKNDPSSPMSPREIQRACMAWMRERRHPAARLEVEALVAFFETHNDISTLLANLTGHKSPGTTLEYFAKFLGLSSQDCARR